MKDFPNEVWLEVFSNLDYFDLKRCQSVSKTFKALTTHSAFDSCLFRAPSVVPASAEIDANEVELHPAFELIRFECADKIEDARFWSKLSATGDAPLTATSAAGEHATDPPTAILRLQIDDWNPMTVRNKRGVTVLQVMKALCRFFSNDDHFESRGDHTGWTGWDEIEVDSKGRLLLVAIWFDS